MTTKEYNLEYVSLDGTIPTELGRLTKLEILDLELNKLSGTIPTELGNLGDTLLVLDLNEKPIPTVRQ